MPSTQADPASGRLVWIDCEMTGLSVATDQLVEVACVVTDADLVELDEGVSVVIKPDEAPLAAMDPVVLEMHTTSGLLGEIPLGTTVDDAQSQVLDYVTSHVPEAGKAPLAGSSVYVDRLFLAKYMPDLDQHLHYRVVDVSSIKELAKRWYPRTYFNSPEKNGNHRALADIRESIAELRFYREAIMVPAPGPDSATAKTLGNRHVVQHG